MKRVFYPIFCFLLAISTVFADDKAEPIPFWQRPDYLLEAPDIISVEIEGDAIPAEKLGQIKNTYLISPDGFVTLSELGRVAVEGLKVSQVELAVREHLAKSFDSDAFEVRVKVVGCNSKEFHIVFLSADSGEQRCTFPYTGHETVLAAVKH